MSTQTETRNALEQFVLEAREVCSQEPDLEKRWVAMTPILAKLLADPDVIAASRQWPICEHEDSRVENLLFYEDSEFGFTVNALTKAPNRQNLDSGRRLILHDHAHIYTLYGVIDGYERILNYRRVDDGSKPDYAEIEKTEDVNVGPGEISLVRPWEVHSEVSVDDGRTAAVIIRSEMVGEFNQGRYDPETNRYWEAPGPRQRPCEMLPTGV